MAGDKRLILQFEMGLKIVLENASFEECLAYVEQSQDGELQMYCYDSDIREVHCDACSELPHVLDEWGDPVLADGVKGFTASCAKVVSEPLYLDGPRDDDSHWAIEDMSVDRSLWA